MRDIPHTRAHLCVRACVALVRGCARVRVRVRVRARSHTHNTAPTQLAAVPRLSFCFSFSSLLCASHAINGRLPTLAHGLHLHLSLSFAALSAPALSVLGVARHTYPPSGRPDCRMNEPASCPPLNLYPSCGPLFSIFILREMFEIRSKGTGAVPLYPPIELIKLITSDELAHHER